MAIAFILIVLSTHLADTRRRGRGCLALSDLCHREKNTMEQPTTITVVAVQDSKADKEDPSHQLQQRVQKTGSHEWWNLIREEMFLDFMGCTIKRGADDTIRCCSFGNIFDATDHAKRIRVTTSHRQALPVRLLRQQLSLITHKAMNVHTIIFGPSVNLNDGLIKTTLLGTAEELQGLAAFLASNFPSLKHITGCIALGRSSLISHFLEALHRQTITAAVALPMEYGMPTILKHQNLVHLNLSCPMTVESLHELSASACTVLALRQFEIKGIDLDKGEELSPDAAQRLGRDVATCVSKAPNLLLFGYNDDEKVCVAMLPSFLRGLEERVRAMWSVRSEEGGLSLSFPHVRKAPLTLPVVVGRSPIQMLWGQKKNHEAKARIAHRERFVEVFGTLKDVQNMEEWRSLVDQKYNRTVTTTSNRATEMPFEAWRSLMIGKWSDEANPFLAEEIAWLTCCFVGIRSKPELVVEDKRRSFRMRGAVLLPSNPGKQQRSNDDSA